MANSVWIGPFGISNNGSGIVFSSPGLFPDGSTSTPSVAFSASPTTGIFRSAAGGIGLTFNQYTYGFFGSALSILQGVPVAWTSSSNVDGGTDTGISRISAGVLGIGTGAQGSFAGTLKVDTVNAVTAYQANGTPGVATFGPSVVTSITVKNGLVTAIS